jgi:hypothetical protein
MAEMIHRKRRSPEGDGTLGAGKGTLSMKQLIATPNELRKKGFRALADTLGWANASASFAGTIQDRGTTPRSDSLPDETLETLTAEIERVQKQARA